MFNNVDSYVEVDNYVKCLIKRVYFFCVVYLLISAKIFKPMLFCFDFRVPYKEIFGGVSALTPYQFEAVNGYSNEYWGWGGEDDDLYQRYDIFICDCTLFNSSLSFIFIDMIFERN